VAGSLYSRFGGPILRVTGLAIPVGAGVGLGMGAAHASGINRRRGGSFGARMGRYAGYGGAGAAAGGLAGYGIAFGGARWMAPHGKEIKAAQVAAFEKLKAAGIRPPRP
jgi:hypothetical protein